MTCGQSKEDFFQLRSGPLSYVVLELVHIRSLTMRPLLEVADLLLINGETSNQAILEIKSVTKQCLRKLCDLPDARMTLFLLDTCHLQT